MTTSPDAPDVIDLFWIGAHKTGTTFLQKSLSLSQAALRAHGIQYPELSDLRRDYTRPLLNPKGDEVFVPPPEPMAGLRQRLIFDENVLSLVQNAVSPAGLYPTAAARAEWMATYLGLRRPTLIIGLRNFRSFLPSLYCEALKSKPFAPFREFWGADFAALTWDDLIGRLIAVFPGSPVLVYTAEALRGREARLLAEVTGLAEAAFTLLPHTERLGFSHAAIMALHEISLTRSVRPEDVRALTKAHPRLPGSQSFTPWTDEEAAALDQRYAEDLSRVAARPEVRWLDPVLTGSSGAAP